jgi:hypothetical protein
MALGRNKLVGPDAANGSRESAPDDKLRGDPNLESYEIRAFCATKCPMKRDEIIEKLRAREADLRAQGVAHAALFGSLAHGDDSPDSDIDILVDLDPTIVVTIFDYAGVKEFIADMFDRPVDVVSRESLKPRVRPKATADAIYAF